MFFLVFSVRYCEFRDQIYRLQLGSEHLSVVAIVHNPLIFCK